LREKPLEIVLSGRNRSGFASGRGRTEKMGRDKVQTRGSGCSKEK
jgi:hypothetical protein